MVKFLIHRPIAVIMTFIAVLLLGAVSAGMLPVSLMPDVDIPEITVRAERPGVSVRELENTIVSPMRRSLSQVSHLDDIISETREGYSLIRLRFKYGTDINYAFIDVNEKVDGVMLGMPRDVQRPAIIKASATDLPVFYINVQTTDDKNDNAGFMELCEFTNAVIRKRLEQLPEIAMVDITGEMLPELYILPDAEKMKSLGISQYQIENVLNENNITLGSLQVIDGQYQYNIRFSNSVNNVEDVKNLYIKANDRILQIKDIAAVGLRPRQRKGMFLQGHGNALSLAVIKQSDARMEGLKKKVDDLLKVFNRDYPQIKLDITRDQTTILDYAISNLEQSLLLGGFLAFIIMFLFLKDTRSPWLIGFSIPVSLVISLLFFHLAGLSLNIISLSGIILGIGMMIDNSIIVIDNITQRMDEGEPLATACINGTNEVIRPLISSVLTTCAVFLPLIFISGIAGALFYDQAIAVTIGLFVSLLVSVTLLPTLYRLFWLRAERKGSIDKIRKKGFAAKMQIFSFEDAYEKGWHRVFSHRKWMLPVFLMLILIGGYLTYEMKKERFPTFEQQELVAHIDWNERISLNESRKRVDEIIKLTGNATMPASSFIGVQQYVMHKDLDLSPSEVVIYFKLKDDHSTDELSNMIRKRLMNDHPAASVTFRFPETIFERLFSDREAPFVARVSSLKRKGVPEIQTMDNALAALKKKYPHYDIEPFAKDEYIELRADREKLTLYEVEQRYLYSRLKAALKENRIGVLRSRTLYVPIVISDKERTVNTILNELKIKNKEGQDIPVGQLVTLVRKDYYKTLYGGKDGEYVPVPFFNVADANPTALANSVKNLLQDKFDLNVSFSGKVFSSRKLLKELLVILLIAIALLYFILAAQFESLSQPVIVLLEVPMDIAGALGLLWLFGGTINLMAMIGIIVMSGIIINDSILKIDTINRLRRQGYGLLPAIETAGKRRLKPILMTSLTTILALVPFLLSNDLGSELQQPLALTVIGGMTIGTLVSLYFVPLMYYYLYRNQQASVSSQQSTVNSKQ